MKNIAGILVIVGCVLTGCHPKTGDSTTSGIKLNGSVENAQLVSFAHLERVTENGVMKVDTLEVDEDGNFNTRVDVPEPSFYRLNFNNKQVITLILTGEENEVTVNAHGNDPRGFSEVSGSYDTEFKNQIDMIMQSFRDQIGQYKQQQMQARNDGDLVAYNGINTQMMQLVTTTEKELKGLIWEASPSLAALYGIQMIDADKNYTFLDSVARDMSTVMPENFHVQNLVATLDAKKSLAIGSEAPELNLPNPDGKMISLSSLRGKYVLIDFWAAWCRPCRAENPNVVRVYNEYSGENFEILGVSLDKTKDAWTRAISQDGLPWLHVSDLKFWNSEAARIYQIHSIPATYLIDPEGKIIAKNLRGASLEAKLREIFG